MADALLDWPGDPATSADSLPLRFAGALHALSLQNKALRDGLPASRDPQADLWASIEAAMSSHDAHILHWLKSPPQTNEVRRSAALIPALHVALARFPLPLALSELGCSGGLNLYPDRYRLAAGSAHFGPADSPVSLAPDWTGPAPAAQTLDVAERHGVDLSPIDAGAADGRLKLLAYLWPDQPERIARTDAAIAIAAAEPATLTKADAADWLAARLAVPQEGLLHVIFHTVAWQYFPQPVQARAQALIEAAGARATERAPLAWFGMEADGGRGASLTLRLWPGDIPITLGRADFHGRWVDFSDKLPEDLANSGARP